jgi:branched-chain amino acid transport system substrate-binding protein
MQERKSMKKFRVWLVGVTLAPCLIAVGAMQAITASPSVAASSSKAPLVIGQVAAVTGAEASSLGGDIETMNAWAKWTNANGGIDGHQVKLISMNTGLDPSVTVSDVTQLIQQDHVIAFVGNTTDVETSYAAQAQKQQIPVIGESLYTPTDWTNPDFYMTGTTAPAIYYGETLLGKKAGATKTADLYCAEAPNCAATVGPLKSAAKQLGLKFVYDTSVSSSAPNYVAPCLAAQSAGANGLNIAEGSAGVLSVAASCVSQGYHPSLLASMAQVTSNWLSSSATQSAIIVSNDAPFYDTSVPSIKTMTAALKKYAPGLVGSPLFDENTVQTWAAGQAFAAAIKAANVGNTATAADVANGLHAFNKNTLAGLAPPLTYPAGKGHLINCFYEAGIAKNKFVTPSGNKYFCAPLP